MCLLCLLTGNNSKPFVLGWLFLFGFRDKICSHCYHSLHYSTHVTVITVSVWVTLNNASTIGLPGTIGTLTLNLVHQPDSPISHQSIWYIPIARQSNALVSVTGAGITNVFCHNNSSWRSFHSRCSACHLNNIHEPQHEQNSEALTLTLVYVHYLTQSVMQGE